MRPDQRPLGMLPFAKGRVFLPRDDRASAVAGLALAGASRPAVVHLHRMVGGAVAVFGPRCLRRARRPVWPSWVSDTDAGELLEDVERTLGHFDAMAMAHPRRSGRQSLAVLLMEDGRAIAFIKVKSDGTALDAEAAALAALAGPPSGPVEVPVLLGTGAVNNLHWLATTALPPGPHLPARREPAPSFEGWLQERLGQLLSSAPAHPHWVVCHGDLAPWNLRRSGSSTWLLDWESVEWGPPDADRTYFSAAAAVVLGTPAGRASREAVEFWLARLQIRQSQDPALNRRLPEILRHMGGISTA